MQQLSRRAPPHTEGGVGGYNIFIYHIYIYIFTLSCQPDWLLPQGLCSSIESPDLGPCAALKVSKQNRFGTTRRASKVTCFVSSHRSKFQIHWCLMDPLVFGENRELGFYGFSDVQDSVQYI